MCFLKKFKAVTVGDSQDLTQTFVYLGASLYLFQAHLNIFTGRTGSQQLTGWIGRLYNKKEFILDNLPLVPIFDRHMHRFTQKLVKAMTAEKT